MRRSARARWVAAAVAVVVAVLAGACTGNRSPTAGSSGVTTATTSAKRPATQPATRTFGDLPSPCGTGTATGATDQGVSDTRITIGYGDDAGAVPSPGLDHELGDAMKAMI